MDMGDIWDGSGQCRRSADKGAYPLPVGKLPNNSGRSVIVPDEWKCSTLSLRGCQVDCRIQYVPT